MAGRVNLQLLHCVLGCVSCNLQPCICCVFPFFCQLCDAGLGSAHHISQTISPAGFPSVLKMGGTQGQLEAGGGRMSHLLSCQHRWLQQLKADVARARNLVGHSSTSLQPSWSPFPSPQLQTPALWHTLQSSQHQPGSSSELPSSSNPTFSLLSPQPS